MNIDRIPTIEECITLMKKHMLPNIFEHSKQVMNVAKTIIDNLKNEITLNRPLIIAASLLHDITKATSLKTKEPHDITGGQFSRKLGFHKVADIIEEHVVLINFKPEGELLEKEIVYYADKRVMHDKIVTVKERMDDIKLRYGKTPEICEMINYNTALIMKVEKKINNFIVSDIDLLL